MGQVILIVVAAAWAAVLLPPLLRNRAENRPNSSVSDFRAQLSSLQRAMPSRGVSVRSMGRSLAPSTLSRPAAPGRPAPRGGRAVSPRGQHSYGPAARGGRADSPRMQEATLRARTHGTRAVRESYDPSGSMRRPGLTGSPMGDVKRRRANVLFMLVLTTLCGGFLAVTTDSKAMVLLFAAGMICLGGYVYLLVSLQQREAGVAVGRQRLQRTAPPMPRQRAPRDPLVRDWRPAHEDEYDDEYAAYDAPVVETRYDYDYDDGAYEAPRRRRPEPSPRQAAGRPAPRRAPADGIVPGSGESGRISYGRRARTQPPRDPYAMPMPRDPRDPFGREQQGREITRGTAVRNGRHATGQHPVQRRQRTHGGYGRSYAG